MCLAPALPRPWPRQPAPSGIRPTLVHVQVDHVTAVTGSDRAQGAHRCRVNVEPSAPVHPEPTQPASDSGHTDLDSCVDQLDPDHPCRPRPFPPESGDEPDDLIWDLGRATPRAAGAVVQASLALTAVTVDPLRCSRPADPHLGGDVGDRTVLTALDHTSTPLNRQGCVSVSTQGQAPSKAGWFGNSHPDEDLPSSGISPPSTTSCTATPAQN